MTLMGADTGKSMLNGMFGKIAPGKCRLSMNGGIAIQTKSGYKTYNMKTGRLTNCSNFVFDIGDDFFFIIPTNKVEKGDIIIASGKPKCVLEVEKDSIRVINYEDSVIENILPERHIFMGKTYFYGKIVSMFGEDIFSSKKGTNNVMKFMMMKEMMNGNNGSAGGAGNMFSSMLPMMMFMGGGNSIGDMFEGMFDEDVELPEFDEDDEDEEDEEEDA